MGFGFGDRVGGVPARAHETNNDSEGIFVVDLVRYAAEEVEDGAFRGEVVFERDAGR